MTIASKFNASGLSSNIDWVNMVDQLVELEKIPINNLKKSQDALRVQVSVVGQIAAKLTDLESTTDTLAQDGVLAVKSTSINSSFTAAPGSGATAGRYSLQVTQLAQPAKIQSATFAASDRPVQGTTLKLTVMGKEYGTYTVKATDTLDDVAAGLRAFNAPVTITTLTSADGSKTLSFTNIDTGYPTGVAQADALKLEETPGAGPAGNKAIAPTNYQSALNATFTVDGIPLSRQFNVVTDVIPDTTLTLTKQGGPAEDLVLENDLAGTTANLQKFLDSYNNIIQAVNEQLQVTEATDRTVTLAGDNTIRSLQSAMQNLIIYKVPPTTETIRTLADLGIQTARDGTLSINSSILNNKGQTPLQAAIATNPLRLNELFSATDGLAKIAETVVKNYTNSVNGLLTTKQKSINQRISDMDDKMADMQRRVDNYRQSLLARFTAMENTISQLKGTSQYLTQLDKSSSSS